MDITKYRNIFPHVAAAIQLCSSDGKQPSKGDIIEYVYTDSQHQNPLNRIITMRDSDNNSALEYDREKYKEMLLDAAETVLGIFGFDRTLFGNQRTRNGGWRLEGTG